MKDYFDNTLNIGDDVVYVGAYGHKPNFQEGKILAFDTTRSYGDVVQVLGNTNTKPGWTYPNRIINKKFIGIG